ncbi:MAG: NUDIX hydrolase YfcD [Gammaproteobacteria bacterium]|nr:NUDIX hydrolase YfcD [Gammaproteobacteria bacterium]
MKVGGGEEEIERARRESVIIVDDRNRVIGAAPREEMRRMRLPHRATFILVFDARDQLLVQKRTLTKDLYPGYFDLAAGGVVVEGESYDQSAQREAEEELGIRGTPLEPQLDFYFEDSGNRCFGRVYACVCEGPFRLQPEEVVSVEFRPLNEVLGGAVAPVTPDTLEALKRYIAIRNGVDPC